MSVLHDNSYLKLSALICSWNSIW